MVLCHLEGLSQKQAARRLRCPVGTVESRLHRARERLRSGLARRGLAPAVGALVGVLERTSRAAVPSDLAKATAAAAARISAGEALAGAVPAAVAGLAEFHLRNMIMRQYWMIAGLIALGLATTVGAVGLATAGGDEPKATPRADDPKPAAKAGAERPEPPLAEKLDRLKAEYEGADRAFQAFYRGSTIPQENLAEGHRDSARLPGRRPPDRRPGGDRTEGSGRPRRHALGDRAAPWRPHGPHAGEFALAASWLVRHFGDDPDAVRVGLELDNWPNAYRDNLLLSFYASAKGRESKGLARLALAQYLERKADAWPRGPGRWKAGRRTLTTISSARTGRSTPRRRSCPTRTYAYLLHLKQCDVSYLRAEAERLYEEVIAEYGDVPYITARDRLLEALLKQPEPKWNGEPLTDEGRRRIEARLARRSTLGQVAEARLDDWHNLAVGKPAPEIKGVDVHGKPLTLSDYRGKVVALVFWGTWCGPCMREIPREKALVERMKGRPFAMLGVNTDADAVAARKVMEAQGVTWPNWHDGEPGEGPIAKLYHVRGYPTVYVIDAEGKIRSKMVAGR